MKDEFEKLLKVSLFELTYNFISSLKIKEHPKEEIDNQINFQFLSFKRDYNLLDSQEKQLIQLKFRQNGKINLSHLNFGSIILEDDADLYSLYNFDPIKVSYHKYYINSLLNLIYSFFESKEAKNENVKKPKGVVVASFFKHLSGSDIFPKGEDETVIDYCHRINLQFHLPLHSRIETDFGVAKNRFDSIKTDILPLIQDEEIRAALEMYFDEISK